MIGNHAPRYVRTRSCFAAVCGGRSRKLYRRGTSSHIPTIGFSSVAVSTAGRIATTGAADHLSHVAQCACRRSAKLTHAHGAEPAATSPDMARRGQCVQSFFSCSRRAPAGARWPAVPMAGPALRAGRAAAAGPSARRRPEAGQGDRRLTRQEWMSSPDGQVSGMAQDEVCRRFGTERQPAIPSTSTRAIAPRQGADPTTVPKHRGCPLTRHDRAMPGRRDGRRTSAEIGSLASERTAPC